MPADPLGMAGGRPAVVSPPPAVSASSGAPATNTATRTVTRAASARSHRRRSGLRSGHHPRTPRSHRRATVCHLIVGVLSTAGIPRLRPLAGAEQVLAAGFLSGSDTCMAGFAFLRAQQALGLGCAFLP